MAARSSSSLAPEKEGTDTFQRHGSIRKVLHSLVGNDSLLGISARMLDRPRQCKTEDDLSPYQHYFREYALISEYNILREHLIPGLYIIPSANSGFVWFGVLFIRSGLYKGGIFRFTLNISENFPDCTPPRVMFENKVFHPSINEETQELNLKKKFSIWLKHENHLWQVLEYTCKIFYQISTEDAENILAAELYENDPEQYKIAAKKCVEQSKCNVYNNNNCEDDHYIRFQEFNENVHLQAGHEFLAGQEKMQNLTKCGLTWIMEGTLKPCSSTPYKT